MTMVPAAAQNLSKQKHLSYGYGGCYSDNDHMSRLQGYDNNCCYFSEAAANCLLGSDLMAEDESRTNSVNYNNEETGLSSKVDIIHHQEEEEEEEETDEGWLQLSVGGHGRRQMSTSHRYDQKFDDEHHQVDTITRTRSGGLVELDLLNQQQVVRPQLLAAPMTAFHVPEFRVIPPRPIPNFNSTTTSLFLQQQGHNYSPFPPPPPPHQEINWAFRPMSSQYTTAAAAAASLSSSSSLVPLGTYLGRPYQLHAAAGVDNVAGPSWDMRVIDPPRRPHSGIWFMLQASQIQAKEPYLPQISKSYLRIKDGRMTVRLLMKYLVNKLRLDSESEIEITCRGQQLLPFLTLKHVRDNIWSSSCSSNPRDAAAATLTLLPDSSTADHVMVLRYGRTP